MLHYSGCLACHGRIDAKQRKGNTLECRESRSLCISVKVLEIKKFFIGMSSVCAGY